MEIGYTLAKTGLLATSSPSPGARRRRASSTRSSPTTSVPGSTSRGTALRLERDRRDRRGDRAAALWHRRCLPAHPDPPRHRRPAAVESMRLLWQGGELDAPRQALHGRPLPHQQRSGRPGRARNRDRTAAGSGARRTRRRRPVRRRGRLTIPRAARTRTQTRPAATTPRACPGQGRHRLLLTCGFEEDGERALAVCQDSRVRVPSACARERRREVRAHLSRLFSENPVRLGAPLAAASDRNRHMVAHWSRPSGFGLDDHRWRRSA
jgi:hypothetical protein